MTKVTVGSALNNFHHPGIDDFEGFWGFIVKLIATWSLAEAVMNEQRGARMTPVALMLFALLLHVGLVGVAVVTEVGFGEEMIAITVVLVIAMRYRRAESWHYLRSGTHPFRHTYFLGRSVFRHLAPILPRPFHALVRDYWFTQRFTHGAVCFGFGVLVFMFDDSNVVGVYLCVSGVLIALKNALLYQEAVNQVLNLYDARQSRVEMPRFLENAQNDGLTGDDNSMGISPALHDVLRHLPPLEEVSHG